jgi:chromosome segregation ATPase
MMDNKNSEIDEIESILNTIPNGRRVLSKKIEEEKALLDAGLVAGLNDNTSLVELENELSKVNKKESELKERVNVLKSEIGELKKNERTLIITENALTYFKSLKKFAEFEIKRIEKYQKGKGDLKPIYPPADTIKPLKQHKNNPIVMRALPLRLR